MSSSPSRNFDPTCRKRVFAVTGNADGSAAERASLRAAEIRPSSLQVVLIERSRKQYAVTVIRDDALPTSVGLTIPLRQCPLDPLAIGAHPTGLGALTQRRLVLREARLARTATLGQRVVDMYTHFSMISLAFAVRLLLAFQESPAVRPGMEDSATRGNPHISCQSCWERLAVSALANDKVMDTTLVSHLIPMSQRFAEAAAYLSRRTLGRSPSRRCASERRPD